MKKKSFNKLSKAEQRVAIAKDVIKQLRLHRLRATHDYIFVSGRDQNDSAISCYDNIGQDELKSKRVICRACAAGSAVLSGIRLFNETTISANSAASGTLEANRWFSKRQLALIETAYEGHGGAPLTMHLTGNTGIHGHAEYVCSAFGRGTQRSNHQRLIAIMRNIIKNDGTFKP